MGKGIGFPKTPYELEDLQKKYDEILEDTISIVEDEIGILIERDSFNFARYSSHLMYLLNRIAEHQTLDSDNGKRKSKILAYL